MKIRREKRITEGRTSWLAWKYDEPNSWEIVVEFHVSTSATPPVSEEWARSMGYREMDGLWTYPGGIEIHSLRPLYGSQSKPSQARCTCLGAPCYHDGSSLAASEFFEYWHGDDGAAFGLAERWLLSRLRDIEESETERAEEDAARIAGEAHRG